MTKSIHHRRLPSTQRGTEELTEIDDIPARILHRFGHAGDWNRQRFIVQPETAAPLDCLPPPPFPMPAPFFAYLFPNSSGSLRHIRVTILFHLWCGERANMGRICILCTSETRATHRPPLQVSTRQDFHLIFTGRLQHYRRVLTHSLWMGCLLYVLFVWVALSLVGNNSNSHVTFPIIMYLTGVGKCFSAVMTVGLHPDCLWMLLLCLCPFKEDKPLSSRSLLHLPNVFVFAIFRT